MDKRDPKHQKRITKIGEKLRHLRIKAGYISYEDFAHDHNLPRVQYWRMEKGTNFRVTTLLVILEKHKLPLKQFFKDID